MNDVTIVIAFVAGIVSFLSPCVLPIVPGFLAYLAGASLETPDESSDSGRFVIFKHSALFVLGFSSVFAVLGVLLNSILQNVAYSVEAWLARIGGLIVIFFGLYLSGLVKVSFLEREHKLRVTKRFSSRSVTSFVFGAAFAAGWTPCVGAALGAILGLAASNPATALYLLFAYSLGLGVPFLVVGLFANQAQALIMRYSSVLHYVSVIFGFILIVLGVLVFTQSLNLIANFDLVNRLVS